MHLQLTKIVRRGESRPTGDRRRKVCVVVAEYRGDDGDVYRKSFESYGQPLVPDSGTHDEINGMRQQWRGEV